MLADPNNFVYAVHIRDQGATIAEIVKKTGMARTSLYRHLPPRPAPSLTAGGAAPEASDPSSEQMSR